MSTPATVSSVTNLGSNNDNRPATGPLIILGPNVPYGDRVLPPPAVHPGGDASLHNYIGPKTEFTTGVPYPCWNYKTMNKPVDPKRWYAVICGLQVGVFEDWSVKTSHNYTTHSLPSSQGERAAPHQSTWRGRIHVTRSSLGELPHPAGGGGPFQQGHR
jgi:hypothetical protein